MCCARKPSKLHLLSTERLSSLRSPTQRHLTSTLAKWRNAHLYVQICQSIVIHSCERRSNSPQSRTLRDNRISNHELHQSTTGFIAYTHTHRARICNVKLKMSAKDRAMRMLALCTLMQAHACGDTPA